jgi:hypothetical protein
LTFLHRILLYKITYWAPLEMLLVHTLLLYGLHDSLRISGFRVY